MINRYDDFVRELLEAGFSQASGGSKTEVFSLLQYGWDDQPPDCPVRWHTGDMETDPWEWRMRVLNERDDIAYGKLFLGKAGYITKEWVPYFLKARGADVPFEERYAAGEISHAAKRIYDVVLAFRELPLERIKAEAGFKSENKSQFDRALTELQMKMALSMCGRARRRSRQGEEYGWSSTVFMLSRDFYGEAAYEKAASISRAAAEKILCERVLTFNPQADEKRVLKFIRG